ncbi:hypothetical protein [Polyangium aurulentum]|uniref:hypothetical protein n=1 Tax=Polyangium aurulentum TaxID=2567896 RepID=UPI0010AE5812|nr:hypothetical protein [Polyangium aurulentum]UQA57921.1 hypothetical protein E8A73_042735 [Polyangium aurulentum]
MATPKPMLPECGLYLTTQPLPGNEQKVPSGTIVYFHNHSDSGLPQVLTPDHNIHNRWHFHGPAIEFRGLNWAGSLRKLTPEGFYTLRRELTFEGGSWPKGAIVQLGYTRDGEGILFIARVRSALDENDLFFSDRGLKIKRDQMNILEPAPVFVEPDDGSSGHGPSHTH